MVDWLVQESRQKGICVSKKISLWTHNPQAKNTYSKSLLLFNKSEHANITKLVREDMMLMVEGLGLINFMQFLNMQFYCQKDSFELLLI